MDALVADYELSKKMTPQVRSHMKPVRVVFGDRKAVAVTAEMVDAFIQTQLAEGYTNASVNRRTQLLGQAFRLAIERNHLTAMPKIRRLDERGNVRHGFFETPEFEAVVSHLPDTLLRELIRLDFIVGWRKGELPSVRWSNVDGGAIRLRAEDSKTREPRVLPLVGPIKEIIDRCRAKRQYVNDKGIVCLSEYVFHIQGTPIKEYRKTWKRACKKAGVPGKLVHDFRRTAVRNMEQAGVPRSVAMKITGHKTESVYRRYAIVSPKDLGDAIGRIDNYLAGQSKEPTVVPLPVKVQAKRP